MYCKASFIANALLLSAARVVGAPLTERAWASRLHDITHSFEFGGDHTTNQPRLVAWNKGVHYDHESNSSFQLYTLDQHQTPHQAILNFHAKRTIKDEMEMIKRPGWHPINKNIRNDTSPGGMPSVDNRPPPYWEEWDCEEDMPCSNNLENYDWTNDYQIGTKQAFCRPWQLSSRPDATSWEWKFAYHQCGADWIPYNWMYTYGMRNTSSVVLEMLSMVWGDDEGRSLHNPRAICLDDKVADRICLSWTPLTGGDNRWKHNWLPPDDILIFRDMHMMCLHNGYSAAGEIKVSGSTAQHTVCVSSRPGGCTSSPGVCMDKWKIRFLPSATQWAGTSAINKVLVGGDKRGPRIDAYADASRVPHLTNSINGRIPWIVTNETIGWVHDNQTDPKNPYGLWGPTYDPTINWPHAGGTTGESWCTGRDYPDWVWCRHHANTQTWNGEWFN